MSLKQINNCVSTLLISPLLLVAPAQTAEIKLSQTEIDRLQIHLDEVRPAEHEAIGLLPATVVPPINGRIALPAPFAGTVVSVNVLPGQVVTPGQTLATIASRELVQTKSQLHQAEANLTAAQAIADRYRDLAQKDIASPTRALETEAHRAGLEAVVNEHRRLVGLGNIETNANGSYSLVAQSGGRVVESRVAPGGSIEAMAPAIVIDTSNDLWVEAQLPAPLINEVRAGDAIVLDNGGKGQVLSVSHSIDPRTRSALLTGFIPADSGVAIGQMVTLGIQRETGPDGWNVPASAVVYIEGDPNVFVRTPDGFSKLAVTLKGKTLHRATVTGPLAQGQQVATSGLAQLENLLGGE
jgi:cobalt-zinc-cadmium efflux system membrane fusion protein